MTYAEKLLDPRWQKKRLKILERDKFSCVWCGDTETTLHVHHLVYMVKNPWESDDDHLISLCKDCHDIYHIKNLTELEKLLIQAVRVRDQGDKTMIKMLNRVVLDLKSEAP